jgi:hypothetical protein
MQIRRHWMIALAASLVLAASASATALTPGQRQQQQLDRACLETVASVQQAVTDAPDAEVSAIHSHLQVVVPGTVTGMIAFSASGGQVSLARRPATATAMSFGCGEATAHPAAAGAGGSRVVSKLRRTFTKLGRYELTFTLDATGRKMLAGLAAADASYFKQHPHGQHPPALAFGAALTYTPAG